MLWWHLPSMMTSTRLLSQTQTFIGEPMTELVVVEMNNTVFSQPPGRYRRLSHHAASPDTHVMMDVGAQAL